MEAVQCLRKYRFYSKKDAKVALNSLRKRLRKIRENRKFRQRDADRLNIYRCSWCGYFHLGKGWKSDGSV